MTPNYQIYRSKVKLAEVVNYMSDNQKADIIKQVVSEVGGFPVKVIEGKSRKREIAQLRQISMDLIKRNTKLTLREIGMHFGFCHHSTIIHATQTVSDLYDINKDFESLYNSVLFALKRRMKTTKDQQKSIAVRKKRLLL